MFSKMGGRLTRAREPMWDVKALATFLGMPTSWVYDDYAKEGVPSFRVGQQLRFYPAEVRRWLEERCRVANKREVQGSADGRRRDSADQLFLYSQLCHGPTGLRAGSSRESPSDRAESPQPASGYRNRGRYNEFAALWARPAALALAARGPLVGQGLQGLGARSSRSGALTGPRALAGSCPQFGTSLSAGSRVAARPVTFSQRLRRALHRLPGGMDPDHLGCAR